MSEDDIVVLCVHSGMGEEAIAAVVELYRQGFREADLFCDSVTAAYHSL